MSAVDRTVPACGEAIADPYRHKGLQKLVWVPCVSLIYVIDTGSTGSRGYREPQSTSGRPGRPYGLGLDFTVLAPLSCDRKGLGG